MFSLRKKGRKKERKKKRGTEYKFHARQLAKVRRCNAHAIRTHIDLLSPRSRIRAEKFKEYSNLGPRCTHT